MTFFAAHLQATADSHRLKQSTSDLPAEAEHWRLEAERFDELVELAATDSARARAVYRPTRAYEPEEVP